VKTLTSHEAVGPYTGDKEDTYSVFLRMHMNSVRGVYKSQRWTDQERPYYYLFDLNAGAGEVLDCGRVIPGSPLRAIDERLLAGIVIEPAFFESDEQTRSELTERLGAKSFAEDVFGSNAGAGVVARARAAHVTRGKQALGLIYADPPGTRIPVGPIKDILAVEGFGRLDVLCRVSANGAYKRPRGAHRNGIFLADDIAAIGKKYALIQEPSGRHQWTFIVLTHWADFPALEKYGFYRIDSPRGKEILDRLNLTTKESSAQQSLPFDPADTAPMRSTSGRRSFGRSERPSWSGLAVSANAAGTVRHRSRITSDTRSGERSMCPKTSSRSAISATARSTGRSGK